MRTPGDLIRNWGSIPSERAEIFGCDSLVSDPDVTLFRAVSVAAPGPMAFRWLCQLQAAPYSYDLLDNLGRISPRTADPALEEVELGQRFMKMFRLAAFEPGRSITLEADSPVIGRVLVSYRVTPVPDAGCRLVAKVVAEVPAGPVGVLMRAGLPAGDLVMMRKQLLTLRSLAERDALATR